MRLRRGFELIPVPAMFLAALAFVVVAGCMFYVMSGTKTAMPEGLLVEVTVLLGGAFLGGVVLLAGYVYGDSRQRGMPPVLWTLLVLLVPNLIGFVLYFLLRKPLMISCGNCRAAVEIGSAFCPKCGTPVAGPQVHDAPVQSGKAL